MKNHLFTKIASYFIPVTSHTYESDISGTIEITWFNGKKMVDTKNANYSYGALQKILHFGLNQIHMKEVNSILLLGMGGGSVIETLRNHFNYTKPVTAIELDETMITIAAKEFGIKNSDALQIIHANAFEFLEQTHHKYDLVIIDLFIDTEVPEAVYSSTFFNSVNKCLNTKGQFIFNAALGKNKLPDSFYKDLNQFSIKQFHKVEKANTIIIGRKNQ